MTEMGWYADDINLIKDFMKAVEPLISSVEAQKDEIHKLLEQKDRLNTQEPKTKDSEEQLQIIVHTILEIEKDNEDKLRQLQQLKETYFAEDLVGAIETLTSVSDGMELSETACSVITQLNDLIRESGIKPYF